MTKTPDELIENQPSAQAGFAKIYAESDPPWDIGKPQPPFVAVADQVEGPVLDAGCGTGGTSVFFAARGLDVTGVDFVEEAIRRAQARADERRVFVNFLVKDAMTFGEWNRRFASVIDSGLFHIYEGEDRQRYVRGLAHVLQPGGRLYLFSFADGPSAPGGGVSRQDLHDAFADSWEIESLDYAEGEGNPAFVAEFPEAFADTKMWFVIIRRK
jgi:SAM-dependent methyltransferase